MDDSARLAEFGRRIRERRRELGLSQEQLGEQSDLHQTYISGIETGQRNVSLVSILKLAHALGVTGSSLLEGME